MSGVRSSRVRSPWFDWSAIFLGRCSSDRLPNIHNCFKHFSHIPQQSVWPPFGLGLKCLPPPECFKPFSHFSHIPKQSNISHLESRSILETELRGSSGSFIARVIHLVKLGLPKKQTRKKTKMYVWSVWKIGNLLHLHCSSSSSPSPSSSPSSSSSSSPITLEREHLNPLNPPFLVLFCKLNICFNLSKSCPQHKNYKCE